MTSMRNSVNTILNKLSIIRNAEKELKEITDKESKAKKENEINEYKQNFLETMNNYVTGGDKFNDQIKNIRDYFTGVAAGQNNKGVLTAYYDYNISNNKFYIDAIKSVKQIGFCGKDDLRNKSIPSDAIDANITKEIMKNFDPNR